MKPKTKLQIRVAELSAQLPPITDEHLQWSYTHLKPFAVVSRKTITCLGCGHSERLESPEWHYEITGHTCQSCNTHLEVNSHTNSTYESGVYTSAITTFEGFQVVRIMLSKLYMKRKQPCKYAGTEVLQYWIDERGRMEVMAKSVANAFVVDKWIWQSDMEIRRRASNMRYDISPYAIYSKKKVLPIFRRNGFKGAFHGIAPQNLFRALLIESKVETLLKSKQTKLMKWYVDSIDSEYHSLKFAKYWPMVRICMRNNYIVKDVSMWEDYIRLLEWFKKDTRNPKYICPPNLKEAHDRYERKKREAIRKQREQELIQEIEQSDIQYQKQKQHFFGLTFSDMGVTVKALESVPEFKMEGEKLNHCVFTNEYYERERSLILSARIDGEPIETIEVNLENFKLMQSRGMGNKATEYHNQIVDIVNRNMHEIIRRAELYNQKRKSA